MRIFCFLFFYACFFVGPTFSSSFELNTPFQSSTIMVPLWKDTLLNLLITENEWLKKNEGDTSLMYAFSFGKIADRFEYLGNIEGAIKNYEAVVLLLEKQNQLYIDQYDFAHLNLANLYSRQNLLDKAESEYFKAISGLILKNRSIDSINLASCYANLSTNYFKKGDDIASKTYQKKSIELYSIIFRQKVNNWLYIQALQNSVTGDDYFNALDLLLYANGLCQDTSDLRLMSLKALICDNIGNIYLRYSDFSRSLFYLSIADNIYKSIGRNSNAEYFINMYLDHLNLLVQYHNQALNWEAASRYITESYSIWNKKFEHGIEPDLKYRNFLYLVETWAMCQGVIDTSLALSNLRWASEISLKLVGPVSKEYAEDIKAIGNVYLECKKFDDAIVLYEKVLYIYNHSTVMKFDFRQYSVLYVLLFEAYKGANELKLAEFYLRKSFNYNVVYNQLEFLNLDTKGKEEFWRDRTSSFENYIKLIASSKELTNLGGLAYNILLFSKSYLLSYYVDLSSYMKSSNNDSLKFLYSEMNEIKGLLHSKELKKPSIRNAIFEKNKHKLDSLDIVFNVMLKRDDQFRNNLDYNFERILSKLKAFECAIEFGGYFSDKDSMYHYLAYILRWDAKSPIQVELGNEFKIHEALVEEDFVALYDLIWSDLEKYLANVKVIYFAPYGELNNVSFYAMQYFNKNASTPSFLIDKYDLVQVNSTRELLLEDFFSSKLPKTNIVLFGGVDYNSFEKNDKTFAINNNRTNSRTYKFRGITRKKLNYLLGTEIEVDSISCVLLRQKWSVRKYKGNKATEVRVKQILEDPQYNVLHISTHGYNFNNGLNKYDSSWGVHSKRNFNSVKNPLANCGVYLAGVNTNLYQDTAASVGRLTGEDGILTAEEISNFNLEKFNLVVLSACETGIGKIDGGEGTFGLIRGFKLAGVENVIATLWAVPDMETSFLMIEFYNNLSNNLPIDKSLKNAILKMRQIYPTEPLKWAGFVLVR